MKRHMTWLLFGLTMVAGCAVEESSPQHNANQDIQLTHSTHPLGWGQSECFACHLPSTLHLTNRRNHASFDLARDLVEQHGKAICYTCHGNNGIAR